MEYAVERQVVGSMSGATMRQRFLEDKENMEGALDTLSRQPDIWQNSIIWCICKALFDILEYLLMRMRGQPVQDGSGGKT